MKKIVLIFAACFLFSGCSPANQPGSAKPSDIVEQTEQEYTDTIVDNKSESTKTPKEEVPTATPEKTEPVETPNSEKEEPLPEKLKVLDYTHLTILGGKNGPAYLDVHHAKTFVDEVLLKAEPIKSSEAQSADYPLSCLLYHDGTYAEYLVDSVARQLKFGEDQYRLSDDAIARLSKMLEPSDMDLSSMAVVELNKLIFDKEDGLYIKVTAAYPDRIFAVLEEDPTVSVEIQTEDIRPANETVVVASMKYWKSSDGKQLFFDQSAEISTTGNWESSHIEI